MGNCTTLPNNDEVLHNKYKDARNMDKAKNDFYPSNNKSRQSSSYLMAHSNINNNNNKNHQQHIDLASVLGKKGILKTPTDMKDWFPMGHGHKKISKLFESDKVIARGTIGEVFESVFNGRICAVKRVLRYDAMAKESFEQEAKILLKIRQQTLSQSNKQKQNNPICNEGIIQFIDMFFDEQYFYLIMERAECNLGFMIYETNALLHQEKHCKIIIQELLKSLQYLHSIGISHRDLKPDNIVFTINCNTNGNDSNTTGGGVDSSTTNMQHISDFETKLIDFGTSELDICDDRMYSKIYGTPSYIAPEILNETYDGWMLYTSDVWSIGCILYEMYYGKACFDGNDVRLIFNKILRNEWAFPNTLPLKSSFCNSIYPSKEMVSFIEQCLSYDPECRMTVKHALDHSWFGNTDKKNTLAGDNNSSFEDSVKTTKSSSQFDEISDNGGDGYLISMTRKTSQADTNISYSKGQTPESNTPESNTSFVL